MYNSNQNELIPSLDDNRGFPLTFPNLHVNQHLSNMFRAF